MKKRELLIVLAFAIVGVVAYQLSAPAPREGERGLSFETAVGSIRRGVSGRSAIASFKRQGVIPLPAGLKEVRVSGVVHVQIFGEARENIAYELDVQANGPDRGRARDLAERTTLSQDNLGSGILSLHAIAPPGGRQSARLTLRMPGRLAGRIDGTQGGTTIEVSGIAALDLDAVGDVRVSAIAGTVTGSHRNGDLAITGSGQVDLTLVSSNTVIGGTRGPVTLNARNGRCRIDAPAAAVAVEASNEDCIVSNPTGTVHFRGSGGKIRVDRPRQELAIDVRRANIEITLDAAVPVTALTTDAPLDLVLDGAPAVVVDAVASEGGGVRADDFALTATVTDGESRVRHEFVVGGARVALRNRRGGIVIHRLK